MTKNLRTFWLIRIADITQGIFGVLKDDRIPFCVTVENNDYVFPDGDYKCKRYESPKYGNTFEIIIEGRTYILFHWGNWEDNSLGCVIVGENYEPLYSDKLEKKKDGVGQSKKAFAKFLQKTRGIDEFLLKARTVKFPEYPELGYNKLSMDLK